MIVVTMVIIMKFFIRISFRFSFCSGDATFVLPSYSPDP